VKKELTLVIGGCRSGKSRHALKLAESYPGAYRMFIATCEPKDEEMRDRVARHRAERGGRWQSEEAPLDLAEAVETSGVAADVLLVDCLTLWISNRLLHQPEQKDMTLAAERLVEAFAAAKCPVVVVSNEVGTGIVPENALARTYRDAVGTVNRIVAASADSVIWMVAGIPVSIKGGPTP
jgi:adenosylcobinamide kinase/adenosylcobinamide-phosphate guanylyltransferase